MLLHFVYFVIWTICRFNNMFIFSCDLSRFKGNVTWYTVNLDLPPSERWTQVIKDKNTEVAVSLMMCEPLGLRPLFFSVFLILILCCHVWRMHVSCLFLLNFDCFYINHVAFSVDHNGTDNKRHGQGLFPWKTY